MSHRIRPLIFIRTG
ncbi:hypothetical protein VCHENC02_2780A, partial [Vibrio harveyi]